VRPVVSLLAACAAVLVIVVPGVQAHESRPAYLEISETAPGRYDVLWRTPLLAGMRLPVALTFPAGVGNVDEPGRRDRAGVNRQRRTAGRQLAK